MRSIRLLLLLFLFSINVFSQDIYSIEAMELFNSGNYSEAISLFKDFAETYQSERGKAYYFIGESYYNQSFSSGLTPPSLLDKITNAEQFFDKASQEPDIEDSHYNPQYKKAWCAFRKAEVSPDPVSYLLNSAAEFGKVSATSNSRILNNSTFMAGESYLRLAQFLSYRSEPAWEQINNYLNSSEKLFQEVVNHTDVSEKRRIISRIRVNDVLLERLRMNIIQKDFVNSEQIIENINYEAILSGVDHQLANQFTSIIQYSILNELLYSLIINPTSQNRNNLIAGLENLTGFTGDKYFIYSLTDFIYEGNRQLHNLADINSTNYENAAQVIPEAWYWLGWLQFINNNTGAAESFEQYLNETENTVNNIRVKFLRESAHYRKLLIMFDNNVSDINALNIINNDLVGFNPEYPFIQQEKNSLHNLVKICLGQNIDTIVQTQGLQISFRERIRRVINLVQRMLERATKVVGMERGIYLNHIENLLHYLSNLEQYIENAPPELKEQIIFYNGLRLFLKAEIQSSQDEKRELYIDAADELSRLNDIAGQYQDEGNYIRARSYFEAARNSGNTSQQNKLFDNAKDIFVELINEEKSLRSAYYLSEIYRLRQNFAASYLCYKKIRDEVGKKEKNNFWYVNADAGLERTKNFKESGNQNVLSNIDISGITYPENLLQVNKKVISMERFADSDYLKQEYFNRALIYYEKYGLPKRDFYPSININENSLFSERIYTINVGIQEKMGELFSNFVLEIICPQGVVYKPTVLLDSLAINPVEEYIFSQDSIKLNTTHILSINNPDCYPFYKRIQFIKPGTKKISVRLQYVLSCISSRLSINDFMSSEKLNILDLRTRNDWNILFSERLNNRGIIFNDFYNNIHFRDLTYSDFHNAYFAVRNDTTDLIKYKNNKRINFKVNISQEDSEMFIPEGIAVDSKGNIYIVNWASHQILIFDSNGNFLKKFGEFGRNNIVGLPVKLTYPTRISISEDKTDKTTNMYLFIADRYGIKIIDSNGNYLDSIINVTSGDEGVYYDVYSRGYGNNTELFVVNRKNKKIEKYTLTEQF